MRVERVVPVVKREQQGGQEVIDVNLSAINSDMLYEIDRVQYLHIKKINNSYELRGLTKSPYVVNIDQGGSTVHRLDINAGGNLVLKGRIEADIVVINNKRSSLNIFASISVKSLMVLAGDVQAKSNVIVSDCCKIRADSLQVGADDLDGDVNIAGQFEVLLNQLSIKSGGLTIKGRPQSPANKLLVEKDVLIDRNGCLDVENSGLYTDKVVNKGRFSCLGLYLSAKSDSKRTTLLQKGEIQAVKSHFFLESMKCTRTSQTQLENSKLRMNRFNGRGKITVNQSSIFSNSIDLNGKFLKLNRSRLMGLDVIYSSSSSAIQAYNSVIASRNKVCLSGMTDLNKCAVSSDSVRLSGLEIKVDRTVIEAKSEINIFGSRDSKVPIELRKSRIRCLKKVCISGDVNMDSCKSRSTTLDFYYKNSSVSNSDLTACNAVDLSSHDSVSVLKVDRGSKVSFCQLFLKGNVSLEDSRLLGIGRASDSLTVLGRLSLSQSKIFTYSTLSLAKEGSIDLSRNSKICAQVFNQHGPVSLSGDSVIMGEKVFQFSAKTALNDSFHFSSVIHLSSNSSQSELSLRNSSSLSSGVILGSGHKLAVESSSVFVKTMRAFDGAELHSRKGLLVIKGFALTGKMLVDNSRFQSDYLLLKGKCLFKSSTVFCENFFHRDGLEGALTIESKKSEALSNDESTVFAQRLMKLDYSKDEQFSSMESNPGEGVDVFSTEAASLVLEGSLILAKENVYLSGDTSVSGVVKILANKLKVDKNIRGRKWDDCSSHSVCQLFLHASEEVLFNQGSGVQGLTRKAAEEREKRLKNSRSKEAKELVENGFFQVNRIPVVLEIKAGTFQNYGKIRVKALSIEAEYIENNRGGTLKGENISLKSDTFIYNMGIISSDYLRLVSNVVNFTGLIKARRQMSIDGPLFLNLFGRMAANNVCNNSLLNFNIGFIHSHFKGELKDVISISSIGCALFGMVQTVLCLAFPAKALLIQGISLVGSLVMRLPEFIDKAPGIIEFFKDLPKRFKKNDGKKMRPFEVYEQLSKIAPITRVVLQVASFAVRQACRHAHVAQPAAALTPANLAHQLSPVTFFDSLRGQLGHLFSSDGCTPAEIWSNFSHVVGTIERSPLIMMGVQLSRAFLPMNVNNNILSVNLGIHFAPGLIDNSLFHWNGGIQCGALMSMSRHLFSFNSGVTASLQSINQSIGFYNTGIDCSYSSNVLALMGANAAVLGAFVANFNVIHFQQDGLSALANGHINIAEFIRGGHAVSHFRNDVIDSIIETDDGRTHLINSQLSNKNQLQMNGHCEMNNSVIKAKHFDDNTEMLVKGSSVIDAEHYNHHGHVDSEEGAQLFLHAHNASLDGSADAYAVYYIIDNISHKDLVAMIRGDGHYANYRIIRQLGVQADMNVNVRGAVHRMCGVMISANEVKFSAKHSTKYTDVFDGKKLVDLNADIQAKNILARSDGTVQNSGNLHADNQMDVHAKGEVTNKGSMCAKEMYVQGKSIHNIHDAKHSGRMEAQEKSLVQATDGDLVNDGGKISAGDILHVKATGDIENNAYVCDERGRYDTITNYSAGEIAGGTGKSNNGVGLVVDANGQVTSDASKFTSVGDGYIFGKNGVTLYAEWCTYISLNEKHHHHLSSRRTMQTKTIVTSSEASSSEGHMNVVSQEGKVESIATVFDSKTGTDIFAHKDVDLLALVTHDKTVKTHKICGVPVGKSSSLIASATPTVVKDDGVSNIVSVTEDVNSLGALYEGSGDINFKGKAVNFGADVMNNQHLEQHMRFNFFASSGLGGHAVPVLGRLQSAKNAGSPAERVLNGASAVLEGYNTAQLMISNGVVTSVLERAGLQPRAGVGFTASRVEESYQTVANSGVNRGGCMTVQAEEKVHLECGVTLHAAAGMDIDAPLLEQDGLPLAFHANQKTVGLSATLSPFSAEMMGASASIQHAQADGTTVQQSVLSSDDVINLHYGNGAIDVNLKGATIEAPKLTGHMHRLDIQEMQDSMHQTQAALSAGTNGQFAVNHSKASADVTQNHSGLIAPDMSDLTIDIASMYGGVIEYDPDLGPNIQHLEVTPMEDCHSAHSFSVSGDVNDLVRSSAHGSQSQVIPTLAVAHSSTELVTQTQPLVSEAMGCNHAVPLEYDGGQRVIVNKHSNFNALIPLAVPLYQLNVPREDPFKSVSNAAMGESAQSEEARRRGAHRSEHEEGASGVQEVIEQTDEALSPAYTEARSVIPAELQDMGRQCVAPEPSAQLASQEQRESPLAQTAVTVLQAHAHRGINQAMRVTESLPAHLYLRGRAAIFNFVSNLLSEGMLSGAHQADVLNEAVADTVGDEVISHGLAALLPEELAGPAGWVIAAAQVGNHFTAALISNQEGAVADDVNAIEHAVEQGPALLSQARHQLNYDANLLVGMRMLHAIAGASNFAGHQVINVGRQAVALMNGESVALVVINPNTQLIHRLSLFTSSETSGTDHCSQMHTPL